MVADVPVSPAELLEVLADELELGDDLPEALAPLLQAIGANKMMDTGRREARGSGSGAMGYFVPLHGRRISVEFCSWSGTAGSDWSWSWSWSRSGKFAKSRVFSAERMVT